MNRLTPSTTRRFSQRGTVISGAALGLVAGAAVYGAVSSSAEVSQPTALKAKAPVAVAPASLAACAAGTKLENGVCVVHVVRTVVVPPSAVPPSAVPPSAVPPTAVPPSAASTALHATAAKAAKAVHAEGAIKGTPKFAAARNEMLKAEKSEEGLHHFGRGSQWASREDFESDFEEGWWGMTSATPTPSVAIPTSAGATPAPAPAPIPKPVPTTTPAPVKAPAPVPTAAS